MPPKYTPTQLTGLNLVTPDKRFMKPRMSVKEANEKAKLEEIQERMGAKRLPPSKLAVIQENHTSEIRIDLKPLSVNEAWQGKRFKSPAYNVYTQAMAALLPKFRVGSPPYRVSYEFGFSNRGADLANPEKCTTDILCKFYGFDDREIYEMTLKKVIVKKGCEYFSFKIESM